MSLRDRFDALEERERKLLAIAGAVLGAVLFLAIPGYIIAGLAGANSRYESIGEARSKLEAQRSSIALKRAAEQAIKARYNVKAQHLGAFLDKTATELSLEIPEIKEDPPVPVGTNFEEHSTHINFHKVGLLKLIKFFDKMIAARQPYSVSSFNIRRREVPDEYDVSLVVASYSMNSTDADEPKKQKKGSKKSRAKGQVVE